MAPRRDVAIVGAGIAGGALATVLARNGLDVLLLERQSDYHDRVRGETMFPWGVAELLELGLDQVLLDAGGGYATALVLGAECRQLRVRDAGGPTGRLSYRASRGRDRRARRRRPSLGRVNS